MQLLEGRLAAYLADRNRPHPGHGPTAGLDTYRGQYAGFMRGAKRWVYASYVPASHAAADPQFSQRALVMCDGGGSYFGVEYDPATQTFHNLQRNEESSVGGAPPS